MGNKIKFNVSVSSLLHLLAILVSMIILFAFRFVIEESKQWLSIISDIFTIVAFLGVILAFADYRRRDYDAKKQTLVALKSQLEVVGTWSSYEGTGYHKWEQNETINKNLANWGNPFSEVFITDSSAIQTIWLTPGIVKLPERILEKISPLNQEILTFNNQINEINLFRLTGDQDLKIRIHLKLNRQLTEPLSEEENRFSRKLLELYAGLHFDFIGDEFNQRLHYKHKTLLNLVKQELEKLS